MTLKIFKFCLVLVCIIGCEHIMFVEDISTKKINLLAPKEGSLLQTGEIIFSWELIEGADAYQLQIAKPNFENATQLVLDSLISDRSFAQQLLTGSYELRLRGVNSGYATNYTTANFEVAEAADFPSKKVTLISPEDKLNSNSTTQVLSWGTVTGAVDYRIQILDSDASDAVLEDLILGANSYTHTFDEGNFKWQVRAQNSTQNTLYSTNNLLIDTTSPAEVSLLAPADGTLQTDGAVTFKWNRTAIAGSQEIDSLYVYKDQQLTDLAFKVGVTNLQYEKDLDDGDYFWYVQAFDAAGNSNTKTVDYSLSIN